VVGETIANEETFRRALAELSVVVDGQRFVRFTRHGRKLVEAALARSQEIVGCRRVIERGREPCRSIVAARRRDVLKRVADAGGWFELPIGAPPEGYGATGGLVARSGDTAAVAAFWFIPDVDPCNDVGTLVHAPSRALRCRVTGGGVPVSGARVFVCTESFDMRGVLAEAETGADGVAAFARLPAVPVAVFAAAPGRARGKLVVDADAAAVDLALAPEHVLTVHVVEPVAGVRLHLLERVRSGGNILRFHPYVPEPSLAPSDGGGVVTIRGLAPDDALVLRAHGYPTRGIGWGVYVPEGAAEFRFELPPARTVRWPVVAGGAPVPADGTPVELLPFPGGSVGFRLDGRIEGGMLVTTGHAWRAFRALAVVPDGAAAEVRAGEAEDTGPEIAFRRPRVVTVSVTERGGGAVAGVAIVARTPGNHPVGRPAVTDDDGLVRLAAPYGDRIGVALVGDVQQHWGGRPLGTVDVGGGDARLDVVLEPEREVALRVLPALPGAFTIAADEEPVRYYDVIGGTIRFRVRPRAPGAGVRYVFAPDGAEALRGETDADGRAVVELVPASTIEVSVEPPEDGVYQLTLLAQEAPSGTWSFAFSHRTTKLPGDVTRFAVSPGRYRVTDTQSDVRGPAIDVVAGGVARATLDLSRVAWARGRVEVPEGYVTSDVRIDASGRQRGAAVGRDGVFSVRASGEPLTLTPVHPLLVPAADGGTAVVTGGEKDVSLRMVGGRSARVRLSPVPPKRSPRHAEPRVLLWRGAPEGEPDATLEAVLDSGVLTFGNFEPGTYAMLLDVPPFAPAVVRDVRLGDGTSELGAVVLGEGARVRVRVLVRDGSKPPRVAIFAHRLDEPRYWRGMNSSGEAEPVLAGLGAGRFRVQVEPVLAPGRIDREIALDGAGEVVLDLDLR
jgi:hypothetical protein